MTICTPLSQLLPVKNVAGILMAVSLSKTKHLINVVGGGETKDLAKLAKNLGIEKQVKFFGSLPNEKAREVLRKSDVFVLNSFHEGLPHAMLEALGGGVPVIATRIPATIEILEDKKTGLLVDVDNPKDLAEKLEILPNYKDILIKNGRRLYLQKFTWEKHLKQLYKLFRQCIAGSRSELNEGHENFGNSK